MLHFGNYANMLEKLFARNPGMPMAQRCSTEAPETMAELKMAVARFKANKAADDARLVAELLHHPEVLLEAVSHLFRRTLLTGEVPATWTQTIFNMLPKTTEATNCRGESIMQYICIFDVGWARSNFGVAIPCSTLWLRFEYLLPRGNT